MARRALVGRVQDRVVKERVRHRGDFGSDRCCAGTRDRSVRALGICVAGRSKGPGPAGRSARLNCQLVRSEYLGRFRNQVETESVEKVVLGHHGQLRLPMTHGRQCAGRNVQMRRQLFVLNESAPLTDEIEHRWPVDALLPIEPSEFGSSVRTLRVLASCRTTSGHPSALRTGHVAPHGNSRYDSACESQAEAYENHCWFTKPNRVDDRMEPTFTHQPRPKGRSCVPLGPSVIETTFDFAPSRRHLKRHNRR